MQFTQAHDVKAFYALTRGALLKSEAQNLVLLGNLILGVAGEDKSGWRDPANWFMATVSDCPDLRLIALMTPPHNLTLYETAPNGEALSCFAAGMRGCGVLPPGVMTESSLAARFARIFSVAWELGQEQRIYELKKLDSAIPLACQIHPRAKAACLFCPSGWPPSARTAFIIPYPASRARRRPLASALSGKASICSSWAACRFSWPKRPAR
ncbi:MAG: hypothetical protein LBU47_02890 [Christensenellaceae bacterium]|jgi:hypothetical protein|nr:hypothetical protein [Christensenellaceae bacterium]